MASVIAETRPQHKATKAATVMLVAHSNQFVRPFGLVSLMPGNQLTDRRHKGGWHFHDCLIGLLDGRLIFCNGLLLGLLLVMGENSSDAILVPSGWKALLSHRLCRSLLSTGPLVVAGIGPLYTESGRRCKARSEGAPGDCAFQLERKLSIAG